jgi:hypothetical protein
MIDLLLAYQGKNTIDESRAKAAYSEENKIPGLTQRKKYNCQFWGLAKIKDNK